MQAGNGGTNDIWEEYIVTDDICEKKLVLPIFFDRTVVLIMTSGEVVIITKCLCIEAIVTDQVYHTKL